MYIWSELEAWLVIFHLAIIYLVFSGYDVVQPIFFTVKEEPNLYHHTRRSLV